MGEGTETYREFCDPRVRVAAEPALGARAGLRAEKQKQRLETYSLVEKSAEAWNGQNVGSRKVERMTHTQRPLVEG